MHILYAALYLFWFLVSDVLGGCCYMHLRKDELHDSLRDFVIYSVLLPPKGLSVSDLPTLFHN